HGLTAYINTHLKNTVNKPKTAKRAYFLKTMETAKKYSLAMVFLLAFFIIASDMATESQAKGVSEDILQDCVNDADCVRKHWPCPSGTIPVCLQRSCTCVH
ncbi:hypothetical protein KIW84_021728, partial [Lathyrus oleraceus]